jgi:hypothetical protein
MRLYVQALSPDVEVEEVPDKERSMNFICMILLILLLLPLHAWSEELPLFVIQRNKNKNEVHYHLHVDDTCRIVSTEPVSAFWKLLQESPGKTAPLTGLQRIVYGVVHKHVDDNWVSFHLMPLKERIVKATATYDPATKTCSPIVHAEINKQWAALERIYVHAEEGLLDPELLYIDLIGKSLMPSPQQVRERIHP